MNEFPRGFAIVLRILLRTLLGGAVGLAQGVSSLIGPSLLAC